MNCKGKRHGEAAIALATRQRYEMEAENSHTLATHLQEENTTQANVNENLMLTSLFFSAAVHKIAKKVDMDVFSKRMEIMLQDMFGEDCVTAKDGSILSVTVDGKTANISLDTRIAECEPGNEDDESLREMVELAAQRLYDALSPVH
nr:cleavage and polyadenylation specificity factor subunit 3-like [Chelonoidis abingdonii]